MRRFISYILTLNILLLMVPSATSRLLSMLGINGEVFLKVPVIVFLGLLLFLLLTTVENNRNRLNNTLYLNWVSLLCIVCMISVFYMVSKISLQPISWRLSGYLLFLSGIAITLVGEIKIPFSIDAMYKAVLIYVIPNAVLGIIQYLTANPIVPIVNEAGESTVAAIRLDNISSMGFLGYNGGYRAFGIFDSGMSLGLFILLALSILLYGKVEINRILKNVLIVILVVATIMTLTRNIYFLLVILIILGFIKKEKQRKTLVIIGFAIQGLMISMASILNTVTFFQGDFFGTLRARYRGLIYFQNYYTKSLEGFLFGMGYQYDAVVKSLTLNTVDNQMYATFLDIGLIGSIIIYLFFWQHTFTGSRVIQLPIQNMLIIFAFFGIANNHIIFFSGILLLEVLCEKTLDKCYKGYGANDS